MSDQTVPLALVAAELGVPSDQLTARLGDDVLVDSVGFRCVERHVAARLIDEHHHAQAAARRRAAERRERFRARDEQSGASALRRQQQARAERDKVLLEVDPDMPALAAMLVDDPDNQLARSGRVLDEMLHQPGQFTYHQGRPR